jgi:hypothetical protein
MDELHPKGFLPRTIPKMGGLKAQLKSRPLFDGPLSEVANLQRNAYGIGAVEPARWKPYSFLVPREFCM